MGSPDGPTRATAREACSSIKAKSPYASGSCGASCATMRPEAQRVLAQARPHQVVTRGR